MSTYIWACRHVQTCESIHKYIHVSKHVLTGERVQKYIHASVYTPSHPWLPFWRQFWRASPPWRDSFWLPSSVSEHVGSITCAYIHYPECVTTCADVLMWKYLNERGLCSYIHWFNTVLICSLYVNQFKARAYMFTICKPVQSTCLYIHYM